MRSLGLLLAANLAVCSATLAAPPAEPYLVFGKNGVTLSSGMDGGSACLVERSDIKLTIYVFTKHSAKYRPVIDAAVAALRSGNGIARFGDDRWRVLWVSVAKGSVAFASEAGPDTEGKAGFPLPHAELIRRLTERPGLAGNCAVEKPGKAK